MLSPRKTGTLGGAGANPSALYETSALARSLSRPAVHPLRKCAPATGYRPWTSGPISSVADDAAVPHYARATSARRSTSKNASGRHAQQQHSFQPGLVPVAIQCSCAYSIVVASLLRIFLCVVVNLL